MRRCGRGVRGGASGGSGGFLTTAVASCAPAPSEKEEERVLVFLFRLPDQTSLAVIPWHILTVGDVPIIIIQAQIQSTQNLRNVRKNLSIVKSEGKTVTNRTDKDTRR